MLATVLTDRSGPPVMEKRGYRTPVRFRGPFHAHQRPSVVTPGHPQPASLVTDYRVHA
jgi:hypothetical protein